MTAHLLFIDDSNDDASIAHYRLRRAGLRTEFRVVCAEPALVQAIDQRTPHLILCDILLPNWDCWAARRVCRRLAPVTPFVLYSGAVGAQDRRLAQQRGCFGWAEKDSPGELVNIVRLALKLA